LGSRVEHCDDADADALVVRRWRIRIRIQSRIDGELGTPPCLPAPRGIISVSIVQAFVTYPVTNCKAQVVLFPSNLNCVGPLERSLGSNN